MKENSRGVIWVQLEKKKTAKIYSERELLSYNLGAIIENKAEALNKSKVPVRLRESDVYSLTRVELDRFCEEVDSLLQVPVRHRHHGLRPLLLRRLNVLLAGCLAGVPELWWVLNLWLWNRKEVGWFWMC